MTDIVKMPDDGVVYTWEFEFCKKPWYRRWFSKQKYEWKLNSEFAQTSSGTEVAPGIMHFEEGGYSHTVHIFQGGNAIIYKKREE